MQAPAQSGRQWWGGRDGVSDAGSDGGDDGGGGGSSYSGTGDGVTKTAPWDKGLHYEMTR